MPWHDCIIVYLGKKTLYKTLCVNNESDYKGIHFTTGFQRREENDWGKNGTEINYDPKIELLPKAW